MELKWRMISFYGDENKAKAQHHGFGTRELWDTAGCPHVCNPFLSGIVLTAWPLTLMWGGGRERIVQQLAGTFFPLFFTGD